MASQAQIDANRLNAQHSSGPRSVEGKAASRFNALKHGIDATALVLPGEDPEARQQLADSYFDRYRPQTPDEVFLVETIIQSDWITRRLQRLEAQAFTTLINRQESSDNPMGDAFEQDAKGANILQKIFRRQQAAQKEWHRAVNALRQLQRERQHTEPTQIPDPITRPVRNEPDFPPPPRPKPPSRLAWTGNEPPAWRL